MTFLKVLLLPLSLIYLLVTQFRNHLYNIGYYPSFQFETVVIGIGNLRVGGTGKTPHVEYLIRLLKSRYKLSTLSRGYGRKTKGFILADNSVTAKEIGDEPMQFYFKYSPHVTVAVGEERALAIPTILFEKPQTQAILLDDAFQHRAVLPDLNILLTDYFHPFYDDLVLPAGRLRESSRGAVRADCIIVTKCPDNLSQDEKDFIKKRIYKYNKKAPVFFTGIQYQQPIPLYKDRTTEKLERILLISGIANAQPLKEEIKRKYVLEGTIDFQDHHEYTMESIQLILKQFGEITGNHKAVFTTEKDAVKLRSDKWKELLKGVPVYYLPIEVYFLEEKDTFDQIIFDCVSKKQ